MSTRLRRRDFLKIVGAATAAAAPGCSSEPARRLIPYVFPQEDMIPGVATWYATTCRECPAGCGVLAKNRDGRIIKVEGNPLHPVNAGKLCARGQASLHELYNPDRFRGPRQRVSAGKLEPLPWADAEALLAAKLREIRSRGRGNRIAFVTDLTTGSPRTLLAHWLRELGQPAGPFLYEPFAYEALRLANRQVFGFDGLPSYRIDRADFLLSLGAGFLETWVSNVEFSRHFASFRELGDSGRKPFVYVGPRLSLTANNADLWIPVAPGDEVLVALGVLRVLLEENLAPTHRDVLTAAVGSWTVREVAARAGVEEEILRRMARSFAKAERPLVLADGLPYGGPRAHEAALAANLLCALKPGTKDAARWSSPSAYGDVVRAEDLRELIARMARGEVEVLLVHRANPAFSLPPSWGFAEAAARVPLVVSFASAPDETASLAHLILPAHTPLECWGDYSPRKGVAGLLQPAMGPVVGSKQLEDILLDVGRATRGPEAFPWADARALVRDSWKNGMPKARSGEGFEAFWEDSLAKGGLWQEEEPTPVPAPRRVQLPGPRDLGPRAPVDSLLLTVYPTIQFFDGRQANRYWLQELPDPLALVTWDAWAELHPDTARGLGVAAGDVVRVTSAWGSLNVAALLLPTMPRGVVALPLGQGHTDYGRFATGRPANPLRLFPPEADPASGALGRPSIPVSVTRLGERAPLAHTDGSLYQYDREIAQSVSHRELRQAKESGHPNKVDLPLPAGFDARKDFYPPHRHDGIRWCMVVDLDRCIGCGACVVACYAENNVAVVGKKLVLQGREMAWLRIQRYFEPDRPSARWLPMLCQHCEEAPCESVCPVFAPHHGKEGLNNQVYNRCIGTRFCLQNDPYKVRRFNWYTFTRPKPLNLQLNPDVTVRQKGVMEKCSFCIQRIVEGKARARNENRPLKDGDFTTACAQTCPTDALVFGNLLDPTSRVSRLVKDPRAYQVFANLNTKPAVIYLKRVTGTWEA